MKNHSTLLSYTLGFVLSIALTLGAFWASDAMGVSAIPYIIGAALIQLFVQLFFFLHLGSKATPRANKVFVLFTVLIVSIVVGGTLWIMNNLERLHMQPGTMNDLYVNGTIAPQNELK
jgi:cytochrome o ubiquinol oxidase operon protein cyoD